MDFSIYLRCPIFIYILVILRLYETIGQKTRGEIHFSESPSEIWETDMMEREISKLFSAKEKILKINFGAYEIKTLKVII